MTTRIALSVLFMLVACTPAAIQTRSGMSGLVAGQVVSPRFTNIWKKEADTWRLYWRHANVIPSR